MPFVSTIILVSALTLMAAIVLVSTIARKYSFNREAALYPGSSAWSKPIHIAEGIAVYARGAQSAPTVLLMPYPHSMTIGPMIDSPLALMLEESGFHVISFDPPGAYASTRPAKVTMDEMIACAAETLDRLGIAHPIPVVGHSMGAYCSLAFTIERPDRVSALVLEGGLSGFPSSMRHGLPGRWIKPFSADFFRLSLWGLSVAFGMSRAAGMKRFYDFYGAQLVANPDFHAPWPLAPKAARFPVPVRSKWPLNMFRGLDHSARLGEVSAPTWIAVGAHDRQTPPACAEELLAGIPGSRLTVFTNSGHAPHLEERAAFQSELTAFLREGAMLPHDDDAPTAVRNAIKMRSPCMCPKGKCPRHGNCGACREYHGRKGKKPACERSRNLAGRRN